jgi:hypothetical protein
MPSLQEEAHMENMDNVRERFEALAQQAEPLWQATQALTAHPPTVERRWCWWRGIAWGLGLLGLMSLPLRE